MIRFQYRIVIHRDEEAISRGTFFWDYDKARVKSPKGGPIVPIGFFRYWLMVLTEKISMRLDNWREREFEKWEEETEAY